MLGMNLERITSSSLVSRADFHRIPFLSIVKDPMECPWRPMCFHEIGWREEEEVLSLLSLEEGSMSISAIMLLCD